MDITRAFGARIGGSSPSEGARQLRSNWRWRRQKDSKAGATTVARRGRGIFPQKNICLEALYMVIVAQLAELLFVEQAVGGSSPLDHPIFCPRSSTG